MTRTMREGFRNCEICALEHSRPHARVSATGTKREVWWKGFSEINDQGTEGLNARSRENAEMAFAEQKRSLQHDSNDERG